jgi:hypothetical protein
MLQGYVEKVIMDGSYMAHNIARFGRSVCYGGVLLDSVHLCMLERVQRDSNGICNLDSVN